MHSVGEQNGSMPHNGALDEAAKKTLFTLPTETEEIQRNRILEEKDTLQNILKNNEQHKEYKPTVNVTTTGPRRCSKVLRDQSGDIMPPNKRRKY